MGAMGGGAARQREKTRGEIGRGEGRPGHHNPYRGGCRGCRDGRHRGTTHAGSLQRVAGSAREDGASHSRHAGIQRHPGQGWRQASQDGVGGTPRGSRRRRTVHRGGCAEVFRALVADPHRRGDAGCEGGCRGVRQARTQRAGDVLRLLQGGDGVGDVANRRRFQHRRRPRRRRGRRAKRPRARRGRHVPSHPRGYRQPRRAPVPRVPRSRRAITGQASSRRESRGCLRSREGWRVQGNRGRRARARVRERSREVARVPRGGSAEG
mmetsp:Transcript_12517/g.50291  ORF Transcript_12517/g.50291 Transcript_12517/m.50291 type:complete len:266 (-) Transcript_12517:3872-4669(-)